MKAESVAELLDLIDMPLNEKVAEIESMAEAHDQKVEKQDEKISEIDDAIQQL